MAGGLTHLYGPAPSPQRRIGLLALVLAVAGVHSCVTQQIADRIADGAADRAMPQRIEVAYVRDMALSTPPVAAPAAPPPPAAVPRAARQRAPKPAKAASAPDEQLARAVVPEVTERVVPEPPPEPPPEVAPEVAPPVAVAPLPAAASAVAAAVVAAVSAPAPASGAVASAFEWPASTRISYELTGNYRGEVSGSAQVEWVRAGSRYQVHLDLIVGPKAAPIITRRMTSDGEITEQGLTPRRYDQDTKVVLRDRNRVTILFEPDGVTLANGDRRGSVPGLQDTASQFVQLTYVFSTRPELLKIGGTVDIPLALPHKVDVWTYDVVEEETLATSFGPLPTVHLKPRRAPGKPGELSAEIWFAPQLRYLPVRIRIRQDADTFIDLMITRRPEIAG